jgi:hypothetical protein
VFADRDLLITDDDLEELLLRGRLQPASSLGLRPPRPLPVAVQAHNVSPMEVVVPDPASGELDSLLASAASGGAGGGRPNRRGRGRTVQPLPGSPLKDGLTPLERKELDLARKGTELERELLRRLGEGDGVFSEAREAGQALKEAGKAVLKRGATLADRGRAVVVAKEATKVLGREVAKKVPAAGAGAAALGAVTAYELADWLAPRVTSRATHAVLDALAAPGQSIAKTEPPPRLGAPGSPLRVARSLGLRLERR